MIIVSISFVHCLIEFSISRKLIYNSERKLPILRESVTEEEKARLLSQLAPYENALEALFWQSDLVLHLM